MKVAGCFLWHAGNDLPHHITSHNITPHSTLHHTTSHHTTAHYITPHHNTLHYTSHHRTRHTPHYTTAHYSTPHHTIPHFTTSHHVYIYGLTSVYLTQGPRREKDNWKGHRIEGKKWIYIWNFGKSFQAFSLWEWIPGGGLDKSVQCSRTWQ